MVNKGLKRFMNSEYQIPNSGFNDQNLDCNEPIVSDVLSSVYDLYASDKISTDNIQSQPEKSNNPDLQRLHNICTEIEEARAQKIRIESQPTRHSRDTKVFVDNIAKLLFRRNLSDSSYEIHAKNELISKESAIGAAVFGLSSDENNHNGFFCEGRDEQGIISWFFHREKLDPLSKKTMSNTLHYEVMPAGILLVGEGYIYGDELNKFMLATEMYHDRVMGKIYSGNEFADNSIRANTKNSKFGRIIRNIIDKNDDNSNSQIAA